ncbi:monosaccharide ABC transporter membrane protein (CUT2 family) [Stackebrandtia endophytica]|uniref:Autoinducer 2 import system permease protein LsrD n=1 Tax=Stackebrandtia endophytica TaxID=1496996 RepID=A0A543AUX1_9ACTN|nr:ABC transporter permease [Stackebrandtia endophytica]TQL76347.1 monosaccharide ABC transporter membrane protein (CUT2 family) [Stackebrandtia endophytica]
MNALTPSRRSPGMSTTTIVYLALVAILVIGAVLVSMSGRNLFSNANIVDLLTRSSLLGFIAIGQTLVILCRSLDLSVGYVMALSSLIAATTMDGQVSRIPIAMAAALGVAAVIGLVNGVVVTKLKVNAFIATLGMGLIIKGYLDTNYAGPAGDVPEAFQSFGYTRIGPIPLSTIVMFAVAAAGIWFLHRSRTGHHMYAVGGDAEVARMSGVRTDRTVITAHVLCALLAGVAGLLIASRFGTGSAGVYDDGYDLESIAAVVLGGTYLLGGRGGIGGTVGGVLILATLDSVFNTLSVDPFIKDVLRGTIIIAAVAVYARRSLSGAPTRRRFPERPPEPDIPGQPGDTPTHSETGAGGRP